MTHGEFMNFIKEAKNVIDIEIEGLKNLSNYIDDNFCDVVDIIRNLEGHLIVTGIGKSGIVGRKISSTMSSLGTPSFFLHPSEAIHGDLGMITNRDIILLISNSGNSEELFCLMPAFKNIGVKTILISGNPESELAKSCDYFLNIGKCTEADNHNLAPTTSTIVSMALGDALSVVISKSNKFGPKQFAKLHPGGYIGKKLTKMHNGYKT